FSPAARAIGRAYAYHFWRPANAGQWLDVVAAFLLWPVAIVVTTVRFTRRNGPIVAERFGRSRARQVADQLRLCVTSGLLPPWYYCFELYRPRGMAHAREYLTRGETKHGAYLLLAKARGSSSPLGDKEEFARFCAERQVATLPVLFSAHDGEVRWNGVTSHQLPRTDLFLKPVHGRGGRGAERWDYLGNGSYRDPRGNSLSASELVDRLRSLSRWQPILVQQRARNHPAMRDLSNGALNTIRMISCLDEREQPELIGAVLRMAVGDNMTVDNVHAGGIAAAVDLGTGRMHCATYAGFDSNLGWIDRHPDTDARIARRVLPLWDQVCDLVRRAHAAFNDWVVVGWDIAIMADGPRLVEGNSGPDIDLIQRPLRTPFGDSRLGELLAFHLDRTERSWRTR
ncbi:MAG TPA: sugar-transfer associated ATP-grasp domain-containing protein, partial [Sphingomicrobium sp.]|nr:sugar-transfer associated ATP-grasp domain-containing protein [Sphingomicrobium sp.]